MLFASFALSPDEAASSDALGSGQLATAPPQLSPGAGSQQLEPDRDAWAACVYRRLMASPLLAAALDARLPAVPVILHPSAPRGAPPPPVTARHLGFLRVDLTGESAGPGRFYPLYPADALEEQGIDSGSLDRFHCTGHWASSGCIRLLTASCGAGGCGISGSVGALALMPQDAFAALWARSAGLHGSQGGSPDEEGAGWPSGWHVPYDRLLPLEEAYGGLCRELKAAGHDLSLCHYMLRGWKTREGRPRLGASAPRTGGGRPRRGVVPAAVAATRQLRAMLNWPGLLELLEEEGVASVPTDGVRYWLARLGRGLQAELAAAGVLCADTSVHHIIARSARGIDHPLNYFLIDKGPNSAMGSRVEGFTDAAGVKLHMRDIVGERAFEVAQAACNLYHGVLYAGRRRGEPLPSTLRELRQGAFALAEETMAARRATEARQAARRAAGARPGEGQGAHDDGLSEQAPALEEPVRNGQKRERCPELGGEERSPLLSTAVLSPTQQQQDRRRRLSADPKLEPVGGGRLPPAAVQQRGDGAADDVQAGMESMSLHSSPGSQPPQDALLLGSRPLATLTSLRHKLLGQLAA